MAKAFGIPEKHRLQHNERQKGKENLKKGATYDPATDKHYIPGELTNKDAAVKKIFDDMGIDC